MNVKENLIIGIEGLKVHKLRSVLTMLGCGCNRHALDWRGR
jgi:hypothetical protein